MVPLRSPSALKNLMYTKKLKLVKIGEETTSKLAYRPGSYFIAEE